MRSRTRDGMRGQTLAVFAVMIPILIGMAGLGTDGANMWVRHRDAQSAADLAALAGARLLPMVPTTADYTAARNRAVAVAQSNGYPSGVTAVAPYVNAAGVTQVNHVEVRIASGVSTYFLPVLGISSMNLNVRAVAGSTWVNSGGSLPAVFAGCDSILGLPPTCPDANKALEWSGSNGDVIGGMISNCTITVPGSGNDVQGGTSYWPRSGCNFSSGGGGNVYSPAQSGALVYTPWPITVNYADFNCSASNPNVVALVSGKIELKNYYQSGKTLRSGIYCATGSSAEIVLGESDVTGTVTLVSQGKIDISGSNIQLRSFHANKVQMWAGGTQSPTIKIAGSGSTTGTCLEWNGIIYARVGQIEVSGQYDCSVDGGSILGDRVKMNGSNVYVNSEGLNAGGVPTLDSLRLYE